MVIYPKPTYKGGFFYIMQNYSIIEIDSPWIKFICFGKIEPIYFHTKAKILLVTPKYGEKKMFYNQNINVNFSLLLLHKVFALNLFASLFFSVLYVGSWLLFYIASHIVIALS